jgi:serine phosphatase RsbU (regulator of sigma subunit)
MTPPAEESTARRRLTYAGATQESDLVVAIFRTAFIVLAALASFTGGVGPVPQSALRATLLLAVVYNLLAFVFAWRRMRWRGHRELFLLLDIVFTSTWVALTWQSGAGDQTSPLFPLLFVVIIIGALWFSVPGALAVAGLSSVFFLLTVYHYSGLDPFALIDAIYRQVVYLFLVAIVAGYVVDTHTREREQWARSQVLLAQYQERFRAAQEMYELLIPAQTPQAPGLEMASRWRPALQEGSGDFYDIITLPDARVAIVIADVSGKFTRGALKLPLFKAAFLASLQVWHDPGEVLSQVNRIMYPLLQPEMFISACVLILDLAHHRLAYSNAGQDPPVFVRAHSRETVLLETGGLVLGIDEAAAYPTAQLMLEPGDTLCLYTDGVTEARSPDNEEFGYDNLEARVQAGVAVGLSAEEIATNIFEAVNQHMHDEMRHDDTTLLVVRYQPERPAAA